MKKLILFFALGVIFFFISTLNSFTPENEVTDLVSIDRDSPIRYRDSEVTQDGQFWLATSEGLMQGSIVEGRFEESQRFLNTEPLGFLSINPHDSDNIITGRSNFGSNQLFVTLDQGETWNVIQGLPQANVNQVNFHPDDSDQVWMVMEGISNGSSLYVSDDKGQNFEKFNLVINPETRVASEPFDIDIMSFNPRNPEQIYLSSFDIGLLRSDDTGNNWINVGNGLYGWTEQRGHSDSVQRLIFDPENPEIVYALMHPSRGIYKSFDGGNTWESLEFYQKNDSLFPSSNYLVLDTRAGDFYMGVFENFGHLDTGQGGVSLGGRFSAFGSSDGGEVWTELLTFDDFLPHEMAFDPQTNSLIFISEHEFRTHELN